MLDKLYRRYALLNKNDLYIMKEVLKFKACTLYQLIIMLVKLNTRCPIILGHTT